MNKKKKNLETEIYRKNLDFNNYNIKLFEPCLISGSILEFNTEIWFDAEKFFNRKTNNWFNMYIDYDFKENKISDIQIFEEDDLNGSVPIKIDCFSTEHKNQLSKLCNQFILNALKESLNKNDWDIIKNDDGQKYLVRYCVASEDNISFYVNNYDSVLDLINEIVEKCETYDCKKLDAAVENLKSIQSLFKEALLKAIETNGKINQLIKTVKEFKKDFMESNN